MLPSVVSFAGQVRFLHPQYVVPFFISLFRVNFVPCHNSGASPLSILMNSVVKLSIFIAGVKGNTIEGRSVVQFQDLNTLWVYKEIRSW